MHQPQQTQSQKIKKLSTLIYRPLRLDNCTRHEHHEAQYRCFNQKCSSNNQNFCQLCTHPHSHVYNVNRIVPSLGKLIVEKWEHIQRENLEIENQWRNCQINVKYCIDILSQVYKTIVESKATRLNKLPEFQCLLDRALEMFNQKNSYRHVVSQIQNLDQKYQMFQRSKIHSKNKDQSEEDKYSNYDFQCIDKQIQHRRNKWTKMGEKTKKFSQKALAFSQTLAQSIQDRFKFQKRRQALNDLTIKKTQNLKQLLQKYRKKQQSLYTQLNNMSNLKIQFPTATAKNQKQKQPIKNDELQTCLQTIFNNSHKMESIQINNKNGRISYNMWNTIATNFQNLSKLRELKLTLRMEDVISLTNLFRQKNKAVRNIEILHLIISDEPKLSMKQVAQFCNTLELRQLYLTLSRDNITKKQFNQFLQTYRFRTSLSHLPINIIDINLSKNKITDQVQISECQNKFREVYQEVKKKNLVI